MYQLRAKVLVNKKVKGNYWRCVFYAPRIARDASAGQFVNVKVGQGLVPLLRRPFSICRVNKGKVEILYEVLGEGTRVLAQRRVGEELDVIGPLGKGFSASRRARRILVAGGMGIAPLLFLAESFRSDDLSNTTILIGAKTKRQILCEKEFKGLGLQVRIATDDGSRGFKGKVTDLLEKALGNNAIDASEAIALYACGPRPMLKEVSRISCAYNIATEVSLEEHMACGIGACLGCVAKTKTGYQRVCKEGPVFNAKEIIWQ
jgi:dihydroorotate dehydrogenase electron transfer subunit